LTVAADGTFDQPVSATPLANGPHQLVVQASDADGQQVQQSVHFTVVTDPLHLVEQNSLVTQTAVPVALGGGSGSRTLSFSVTPQWDTPSQATASNDLLAVYLVNPDDPSRTLLSNGQPGTPLFTVSRAGPTEFLPGLVRYDGSEVQIDATGLASATNGLLVFQLVSGDGSPGSSVQIGTVADTVDPNGSANPVFATAPETIVSAGPALDLMKLGPSSSATVLLSAVRVDASSGTYIAELRVRNDGTAPLGQDLAVVFPGLPTGVMLQGPSGTDANGAPYLNLRGALNAGGLAVGSTSDAVLLTLSDPRLVPFALTPQVLASAPSQPPVLSPLGPLTVAPGGYLAVKLQATSTDGNPITWSMRSTSALPTGGLQADGTLVFQPSPTEVGTYTFTVVAHDGFLEAAQPVTLTVAGTAGSTTSISGVIEDTNNNPVAGVPISLGSV
jgi:hypothetical protein